MPGDEPNEAQLKWDTLETETKARSRGFAKYLSLSELVPLEIGEVHVLLGDAIPDLFQCSGLLEQPRLHVEIWPAVGLDGHFLPKFLRDRGQLATVLRRVF